MSAPEWTRELALVDAALVSGDVPHALTHLGAALALAPNEERVHAGVEAIASKPAGSLREGDRARELLKKIDDPAFDTDVELIGLRALCEMPLEGDGVDALDALRRSLRGPLEQPGDATANIFREHREKLPPGTARLKLAVSGWESPSNHLLVALFMSGTSELAQASYELKDVVTFSRDPLAQVRGAPPPTWKKWETQAVHAAAVPPAELRAQLAEVGTSTDFAEVWRRAGALAAKLEARPEELIAAMVHPPFDAAWLEALPAPTVG